MRYRLRMPADARNGAAAVEMAIILPFLLFVFAVVVDFSRVYFDAQGFEVTTFNDACYASGFAFKPSPGPPTPRPPAPASGTVTVSDSADFLMVTPLLYENQIVQMNRTLVAPWKP